MPTSTKKLTRAQRSLLIRWIKQGGQYQQHWAYSAPKRPAVPALAVTRHPPSAIRNPIDSFIVAKLAEKHFLPSPQADRRTLIRRIYLDLKVQSKKGWQKNPGMMKELGYVLPKA